MPRSLALEMRRVDSPPVEMGRGAVLREIKSPVSEVQV